MTFGRMACALAVLAVFCVLSIFFFPGIEGPYPAVHGPVTALLSVRAAARLRNLIRAGVRAIRIPINSALFAFPQLSLKTTVAIDELFLDTPSAASVAVLRC